MCSRSIQRNRHRDRSEATSKHRRWLIPFIQDQFYCSELVIYIYLVDTLCYICRKAHTAQSCYVQILSVNSPVSITVYHNLIALLYYSANVHYPLALLTFQSLTNLACNANTLWNIFGLQNYFQRYIFWEPDTGSEFVSFINSNCNEH